MTSTKVQHTRGPWYLAGECDEEMRGSSTCDNDIVAPYAPIEGTNPPRVTTEIVAKVVDGFADANAKLIASSPELLAFAQWAVHQLQGDSGTGDTYWSQYREYHDGLAAIARATGQA